MCEHLDKAKGALEAARDAGEEERKTLLDIALIQATVAQAEALHRIADELEVSSAYATAGTSAQDFNHRLFQYRGRKDWVDTRDDRASGHTPH